MKRSVVLFMIIMALVFVFSGCDALQGLLSPEPVEVIVEEETVEFRIAKVKGPSGRTDEETAVFTWTIEDPDRQIANYEFRKDGGDWLEFCLETEYAWTSYSRGPHSFEVRAQDIEGAYSYALIWKFTYGVKYPVIITSAGQSIGTLPTSMNARKANLEFLQDDTILAEELTEENAGTLIIVVGVSLRGLGAKGLTLEQEKQRIRSLLDKAEAIGVDVILAYVEGKANRGGSTDELIDIVLPRSITVWIVEESDFDKKFTRLCEKHSVKLVTMIKRDSLVEAIRDHFGL